MSMLMTLENSFSGNFFIVEVVKGLSDTTLYIIYGVSIAIACMAVYSNESEFKNLNQISKIFLTLFASVLYIFIILIIITLFKYFT